MLRPAGAALLAMIGIFSRARVLRSCTIMKTIDLDQESVTLEDVIELARQDAVSILTARGEEVYVAHLGQERNKSVPTGTKKPDHEGMTVEEVEEAIEEELAILEGRASPADD